MQRSGQRVCPERVLKFHQGVTPLLPRRIGTSRGCQIRRRAGRQSRYVHLFGGTAYRPGAPARVSAGGGGACMYPAHHLAIYIEAKRSFSQRTKPPRKHLSPYYPLEMFQNQALWRREPFSEAQYPASVRLRLCPLKDTKVSGGPGARPAAAPRAPSSEGERTEAFPAGIPLLRFASRGRKGHNGRGRAPLGPTGPRWGHEVTGKRNRGTSFGGAAGFLFLGPPKAPLSCPLSCGADPACSAEPAALLVSVPRAPRELPQQAP